MAEDVRSKAVEEAQRALNEELFACRLTREFMDETNPALNLLWQRAQEAELERCALILCPDWCALDTFATGAAKIEPAELCLGEWAHLVTWGNGDRTRIPCGAHMIRNRAARASEEGSR